MPTIFALCRALLLLLVVTRSRDLTLECHVTKHKTPARSNFPLSNFENSGTIQFSSSSFTSRGLCPKNFEKRAHPNEITLRWIPVHCGYEGNELADQLAISGSNNDRATRIKLPMPRCVCYAALRRKTRVSWIKSYKLNLAKMFNILWRDKFSKDLIRMNKRDLRAATQIFTEHACLNYHLSKFNRSVQPLCPLCEAEYDTVPHLLAQCSMLWQLRVEFFDTHYTTVTTT